MIDKENIMVFDFGNWYVWFAVIAPNGTTGRSVSVRLLGWRLTASNEFSNSMGKWRVCFERGL